MSDKSAGSASHKLVAVSRAASSNPGTMAAPRSDSEGEDDIFTSSEVIDAGGDEDTVTATEGETGTEHEDELGEEGETSTGKKHKQKKNLLKEPPWVALKDDVRYTFEPVMKIRKSLAKSRGVHLKDLAIQMHRRTGAEVYLKVQYTAARTYLNYCYGHDFLLKGEGDEVEEFNWIYLVSESHVAPVDIQNLPKMIEDSVSRAVEKLPGQPTQQPRSDAVASQALFMSPLSRKDPPDPRRRIHSGEACVRCTKTSDIIKIGDLLTRADWFKCVSSRCPHRVHNECLGFTNVIYATIVDIAPWKCDLHRGEGRLAYEPPPPESAPSAEASEEAACAATTAGRGRPRSGRGSRGPRGKRGDRGNQ